jgi:hypothetical protein
LIPRVLGMLFMPLSLGVVQEICAVFACATDTLRVLRPTNVDVRIRSGVNGWAAAHLGIGRQGCVHPVGDRGGGSFGDVPAA